MNFVYNICRVQYTLFISWISNVMNHVGLLIIPYILQQTTFGKCGNYVETIKPALQHQQLTTAIAMLHDQNVHLPQHTLPHFSFVQGLNFPSTTYYYQYNSTPVLTVQLFWKLCYLISKTLGEEHVANNKLTTKKE